MKRSPLTPYPFLFALLAICARLPFLLTGRIPFDSDEAVEGLMARHVLNGELPAFFWGQAFKGVPEVYAAAGAFACRFERTVLKPDLGSSPAFVALNCAGGPNRRTLRRSSAPAASSSAGSRVLEPRCER